MVLLKTTEVVLIAVKEYIKAEQQNHNEALTERLALLEIGSPIDHQDLIALSKALLIKHSKANAWRLDALLRGTSVYVPPPPKKPEPTAEYKALMQRLRQEEEQRQYERMTASHKDPFAQPTNSHTPFNPLLSHGRNDPVELDEATFQDIDRQLTLIINVLVTVIASGITIWFAARYWSAPSRIALSLGGSLAIAIAEVVVYMGYIRKVQDAKTLEKKKVEHKQVSDTWIIQKSAARPDANEGVRHRKGKHR